MVALRLHLCFIATVIGRYVHSDAFELAMPSFGSLFEDFQQPVALAPPKLKLFRQEPRPGVGDNAATSTTGGATTGSQKTYVVRRSSSSNNSQNSPNGLGGGSIVTSSSSSSSYS